MKSNAKRFVIICTVLLSLNLFAFQNKVSAADSKLLTPALSIIANGLELAKCGLNDNNIYFTKEDFQNTLGVEKIGSITFTSVPSVFEGELKLGEMTVSAGQTVALNDIPMLHFVPAASAGAKAVFGFTGNGLSYDYSVQCNIYLLDTLNYAPVLSRQTSQADGLQTQQNIMVFSQLKADDPENDALVFEIKEYPKHGIAALTDKANGYFTYTPANDFIGNDSFEYTVRDIYGNSAGTAEMTIKVVKPYEDVLYTDMIGNRYHNDAIKATSYNLMEGSFNNGKLCFCPDNNMSRCEFLVMAMKAAGFRVDNTVTDVGFKDKNDIPSEYLSYVSYAEKQGMISGTSAEDGVYFYPNGEITRAEGAVILSNILKTGEATRVISFSDKEDIPSWAESAVMSIAELGIMTDVGDGSYSPNSNLTKGQASHILCSLYELKNPKT